jgi:bifunctional UDP-N-acetylglucosamine pyrophosphorylase/glucosamine-1-phosphate N-acetyltransferase
MKLEPAQRPIAPVTRSNRVSLAIVIMAAGKGTRLKSKRPKVLHAIGGRPLLGHVIAAASKIVRPEDIFVIVGHCAKEVEAAIAETGVRFVHQQEQLGTGHAIQCAAPSFAEEYSDILVLSGDVPLIQPETIEALRLFHVEQSAAMTILTAHPSDPYGYGRIMRSAGAEVSAIVEQKDLGPGQESIGEINSGIYAFRVAPLIRYLNQLSTANNQKELYLTEMAGILRAAGERVVALEAKDASEILGANTIAELVALDSALRFRTAHTLMAQGVTIFHPESCVIDATVEIAPDTVIEPGVQLLGHTRIGSDCHIRSGSVIENCTLGEGVLIRQYCILADSTVANDAKIGPFAHLRPGSEIGPEAHIGNFVETKKAKLGKGAKASHLTYLGDAQIGAGTNIGAGVITCNYDGVNKHTTIIGEGVFVGSDSTLVAPITIGDGAYIGAGSCITKEVPPDALAVGRARQITKEGWAAAKRERLKREC